MNKTWNELYNVDVSSYVNKRDGADYLPWATVVYLMHKHGDAQRVYFTNLHTENGSSVFMTDQAFADSKGNTNRCYEVHVLVTVDDDTFEYSYPVLNGVNPVKDNSLNQNAIHKASERAAVKAIALRYGLGFSLWMKDDIDDGQEDDLYKHSIHSVCERVQQTYTRLVRKGMTTNEIAEKLGKTPDDIKALFSFYNILDAFEKELLKL
jgi:hypothetical protein